MLSALERINYLRYLKIICLANPLNMVYGSLSVQHIVIALLCPSLLFIEKQIQVEHCVDLGIFAHVFGRSNVL